MTMSVCVRKVTLVITVRMLWIAVFSGLVKMELNAQTLSLTITAPAQKNLMYEFTTENLTVNHSMLILFIQGRNCEIDLNMCRSDPCFNGATCSNSPNTFECTCVPGFTGPICNNTDECASSPCVRGDCTVGSNYKYWYMIYHPPTGHARQLQL